MEEVRGWIQIILSFAGIVASVVAVWYTSRQIRLSNEQTLFNLRLKLFVVLKSAFELYKVNKEEINEDCLTNGEAIIIYFLGNVSLKFSATGSGLIKRDDILEREQFRREIYEFKINAEELSLIFPDDLAQAPKNFLRCYSELLDLLYQFQFEIDRVHSARNKMNPDKFKEYYPPEYLSNIVKDFGILEKKRELDEHTQRIEDENIIKKLESHIQLSKSKNWSFKRD